MEPAEEIVTSWLKQKGYLTMNEVKVGYYNKEIDILASNPKTDEKLHVEVHVSIRPSYGLRAWSPAEYGREPLPERIRFFYLNKFVGALDKETRKLKNCCVEERVSEILGTEGYDKMIVVGNLHRTDPREKMEEELERYGVKLVLMKDVLREMSEKMEEVYMDDARRYLQIFSTFYASKQK